MKRLFVGLELPASCVEILAQLDPGVHGVEWLPLAPLNLPLSLQWTLDSVEEERLSESLEHVIVPPFFLPLTGIRSFGKAPSISIAVGIGKGHPHLFALHRYIQDAAIRARVEPDLKPFHPQVIVGIAEEVPQGPFLRFLRENAETEFSLWPVNGFTLFSVERFRKGAAYSVEMQRVFEAG